MRISIWTMGGLLLLAVLGFASLTQGLADISVQTVIEALVSPADHLDHHMIRSVRLPRMTMALLAGAALAVAGTIMQTVTRNPLASETTLGVNAGAYLAVVVGTLYFPVVFRSYPIAFAALGGIASFLLVYWLSGARKSTPVRFVLSGMIVTLTMSSFSHGLFLFNQEAGKGIYLWGSGSLIQNNWTGVSFSSPWVIVGTLLAILLSRQLDLLALDEDTARSLGQRLDMFKALSMAIAVISVSVIVSVVGPIGFVGLVTPHLVKLSGIRRHALLLPLSALWGAALLIGADTLARRFVDAYGELPAGAVTAMIGAPCLVWLAIRSSKRRVTGGETQGGMGLGGRLWRFPIWWLFAPLMGGLVLLTFLSLSIGSISFSLSEMLTVISGNGEAFPSKVLLDLRLPRLLVAALAGAALAGAGSLMQNALRNPLADPHVLGITGGAGLGAMILMVALPQVPIIWMPVAAICGALLVGMIVLLSGWRSGLSPMRLTLVGIAMSAITSAFISLLVIQAKLAAAPALLWLSGSTYGQTWQTVYMLAIGMVILLPIGWLLGRRVELLTFSESSATGLGLAVKKNRLFVIVLAIVLTALAVSAVGTIGFVGLLAPHAARMLVGSSHRVSFSFSVTFGAILLMAADLIGRTIMAPIDLPAGIVVSLIGATYLVFLLYKSARSA